MVLICAALHVGVAQTQLPYFSGFDDSTQNANWKTFRIGSLKATSWDVAKYSSFSPKYCVSHIYPVNGDELTEDWFVSPPFKFTSGGKIDSLRYLFTGYGIPDKDDTVALYLLTGSNDPVMATSKTLLYDFRGSDYKKDTWNLLKNINIPANAGSVYLALRYHTILNWLDVKFDNFAISSKNSNGVSTAKVPAVCVFPNPATNEIRVQSLPVNQNFILEIYDLNGKKLATHPISHDQSICLNLPSGPKFYQIIDLNGLNWGQGTLIVK